MNMSEEKFFNNDMSLQALLDGRHWDDTFGKPKVKTFDPIYGPTPFHSNGHIIARFERQICLKCRSFSFAYQGIFRAVEQEDKSIKYTRLPEYTPYENKEVTDLPIPFCYEC